MLDPRIKNAVVKIVDVSYGGDNGFNQAIELSADTLANVKFVQEKKLISTYFDELAEESLHAHGPSLRPSETRRSAKHKGI